MCKILSHTFAWNYVNTGGDAIVLFNTFFERTVFFNLPCNFCDSSRGLTRKNELMNGGYVSMGIFDSRVLSVTTDCKVLPQHCDCWRCWGTKEISNFEKKKRKRKKGGKKKVSLFVLFIRILSFGSLNIFVDPKNTVKRLCRIKAPFCYYESFEHLPFFFFFKQTRYSLNSK